MSGAKVRVPCKKEDSGSHLQTKFKEIKMKIDGITKFLLLLIGLGLWANALVPILRPMVARADSDYSTVLSDIAHDVHNLSICVSGFHVTVHNE
jgi:hypothetical protein